MTIFYGAAARTAAIEFNKPEWFHAVSFNDETNEFVWKCDC